MSPERASFYFSSFIKSKRISSTNMLGLMVSFCVLMGAFAAPQFQGGPGGPGGFVPIASYNYDLNPDGSYMFSYASADGSNREEVGVPRVPGPEGLAVAVQGRYAYEGQAGPVQVSYVADEFGFQPTGNSIHPSIIRAVADQVARAKGGAPGGPA